MYKNRIRQLREDKDLRQIDVSAATGIDQKTLSNYETGKTNPDSYAIIKLCDFFNVTADYLLGYSNFNIKFNEEIALALERVKKELDYIQKLIQK